MIQRGTVPYRLSNLGHYRSVVSVRLMSPNKAHGGDTVRIITFENLEREKGIPYCRDHLRRLVKAGKFPKPVQLGTHLQGYIDSEIDEWLKAQAAKRDQAA